MIVGQGQVCKCGASSLAPIGTRVATKRLAPVKGINRIYGIPNNLMYADGLPAIAFGGSLPSSSGLYADLLLKDILATMKDTNAQLESNLTPYVKKSTSSATAYLLGVASDILEGLERVNMLAANTAQSGTGNYSYEINHFIEPIYDVAGEILTKIINKLFVFKEPVQLRDEISNKYGELLSKNKQILSMFTKVSGGTASQPKSEASSTSAESGGDNSALVIGGIAIAAIAAAYMMSKRNA